MHRTSDPVSGFLNPRTIDLISRFPDLGSIDPRALQGKAGVRPVPLGTKLPTAKPCPTCHYVHVRVHTKAVVCVGGHVWISCHCASTLLIRKGDHSL